MLFLSTRSLATEMREPIWWWQNVSQLLLMNHMILAAYTNDLSSSLSWSHIVLDVIASLCDYILLAGNVRCWFDGPSNSWNEQKSPTPSNLRRNLRMNMLKDDETRYSSSYFVVTIDFWKSNLHKKWFKFSIPRKLSNKSNLETRSPWQNII